VSYTVAVQKSLFVRKYKKYFIIESSSDEVLTRRRRKDLERRALPMDLHIDLSINVYALAAILQTVILWLRLPKSP
jgi:hypothetical protein